MTPDRVHPPCRVRDLGIVIGSLTPGGWNAITDVPGVRVGHASVRAPGAKTGVTAIIPAGRDLLRKPVPAGFFTGNGHGKFVGSTQIVERGEIETPILLTGTLATFRVADALVDWVLTRPGNEAVRSVNPVVGETNDNHWRRREHRTPITAEHVRSALAAASAGPVLEGCVGAGTGTICLGYKAGIGTASRLAPLAAGTRSAGVLVQANFPGRLRIAGLPATGTPPLLPSDGSIVLVVATDAQLEARQLHRLAKRAVYALSTVGASYADRSGDYAVAFSTGSGRARAYDSTSFDLLGQAVIESVEESVLNALTMAESTVGVDGTRADAIDVAALVESYTRRRGAI